MLKLTSEGSASLQFGQNMDIGVQRRTCHPKSVASTSISSRDTTLSGDSSFCCHPNSVAATSSSSRDTTLSGDSGFCRNLTSCDEHSIISKDLDDIDDSQDPTTDEWYSTSSTAPFIAGSIANSYDPTSDDVTLRSSKGSHTSEKFATSYDPTSDDVTLRSSSGFHTLEKFADSYRTTSDDVNFWLCRGFIRTSDKFASYRLTSDDVNLRSSRGSHTSDKFATSYDTTSDDVTLRSSKGSHTSEKFAASYRPTSDDVNLWSSRGFIHTSDKFASDEVLSVLFRDYDTSCNRAISRNLTSGDEHSIISKDLDDIDDSRDPTWNEKHSMSSKVSRTFCNIPDSWITRVDFAFKLILVVCAVMTLTTVAITIAFCTTRPGSQRMSEPTSQYEICIDDVHESWSTSGTEPMYEKLERRTVNGGRQVCAKNPEQLSVLAELAMKMRKVKSEIYLPQEISYTFTPVSAHKLLQPPDTETDITEPTVSNRQIVAWLNSDTTIGSIEHAKGVTVTKDSLLIQHPGLYYVYLGVHFQPVSDRPAREFVYQKWVFYTYRTSSKGPKRDVFLLRVAHTIHDNSSGNQETTFAGGSFYLEAGDQIQVAYPFLGVVKFNTESSYLGLMLLDSGKEEHSWF